MASYTFFPVQGDIQHLPFAQISFSKVVSITLLDFITDASRAIDELFRVTKPGVLFFFYIFGYSLSQIIVFFFRDNIIVLFGLKQAQLTAIGVIIVAAIGYWQYIRWQKRKGKIQD